jgi:hypothetical protein
MGRICGVRLCQVGRLGANRRAGKASIRRRGQKAPARPDTGMGKAPRKESSIALRCTAVGGFNQARAPKNQRVFSSRLLMPRLRSRQIAAMLGINLACDKQEKAGRAKVCLRFP